MADQREVAAKDGWPMPTPQEAMRNMASDMELDDGAPVDARAPGDSAVATTASESSESDPESPDSAVKAASERKQVMKPVLTPVRHSARRKHVSLDSTAGQLGVRIPTRFDASVDPANIRLQQCVIDGVVSLADVQVQHADLAAAIPMSDADVKSTRDALTWLLYTARGFPHPKQAASDPFHRTVADTTKEYYHSLLLRANVLMSKLPLHTDGSSFMASICDESESDDDENEPVVEPLRQHGAQAIVGTTIRRPGQMTAEEEAMVGIDLWCPEGTEAQYKRRALQEVHLAEAWRTLLPRPELHNTRGRPLTEEDVRPTVVSHSVYVPTPDDIEAFSKAQNAHGQNILEIIGAAESERLGHSTLSSARERRRWMATMGEQATATLEMGLSTKKEGLEAMRRQLLPMVRMYDVVEYYYKVWRTLSTSGAQSHYIAKAKDKRMEHRTYAGSRLRSQHEPAARATDSAGRSTAAALPRHFFDARQPAAQAAAQPLAAGPFPNAAMHPPAGAAPPAAYQAPPVGSTLMAAHAAVAPAQDSAMGR